jgi:predicted nucleic acid-binding protein
MLVLDASAALTWCFIDEHTDFGERLLDAVQQSGAMVPALWHTEVANLLLASLRYGRLDAAELDHLRTVFDRLPVQTEVLGP